MRCSLLFTLVLPTSVACTTTNAHPGAEALEACVEGVLTALRFDACPVGGPVRFSTAFVFSSQ